MVHTALMRSKESAMFRGKLVLTESFWGLAKGGQCDLKTRKAKLQTAVVTWFLLLLLPSVKIVPGTLPPTYCRLNLSDLKVVRTVYLHFLAYLAIGIHNCNWCLSISYISAWPIFIEPTRSSTRNLRAFYSKRVKRNMCAKKTVFQVHLYRKGIEISVTDAIEVMLVTEFLTKRLHWL